MSTEIFIRAQREALAKRREGISRRSSQIERQRERRIALFGWDRYHSRGVPDIGEAGQTSAFSFEGIDGKILMGAPARMRNVIRTTPDRASRPCIHDIKHQRRVTRGFW